MDSQPTRILIVEDEARIAALLADYLRANGFSTQIVDRGDQASAAIAQWQPALLLLDLNLPGLDGLSLCRQIRARSTLPIIMITARVEELDRLLGLDLGADDYICKPFSPREVVARVRSVLRRSQNSDTVIGACELQLDRQRQRAHLNGQALQLTAVEFGLLEVLAQHPGRVWSRANLLDQIYQDFRDVSDRAIDSHIKNLRRKLETAAPQSRWIHSVYGVGYRFEEESVS